MRLYYSRPHYATCPSVCPSVCLSGRLSISPVQPPNLKTKWLTRRQTNTDVNVFPVRQFSAQMVKGQADGRIICRHWADNIFVVPAATYHNSRPWGVLWGLRHVSDSDVMTSARLLQLPTLFCLAYRSWTLCAWSDNVDLLPVDEISWSLLS